LVVVAEYQKTIAIENLATKREMTVLPLRIDCRNFPYRSRNIISPVQFIQIGFYGPVKDQDTMFEAFAKVSEEIDCRLVVIGAGFNIPKAYDLVNKLRIAEKVTFAGIVSQAELPRFFSRAHILLHTARFETGCAVVQEAMASGVAVCGTNVGLLADIGEDYAVIVPPQNPTLLANEILKLVYDNARYEFITANAFRWITQYDASWAAENYHRFIKRFISEER
jgi:glycosyltransferase involved in cell wall biosynthesis